MRPHAFVTKSTFAALCLAMLLAPSGAFASLTPPPKEWAMFPQDEPPQQQVQNGRQGNPNMANNTGGMGQGSAESSGGISSSAHARSGRQKELPLFWMLLTGVLSLGAAAACGSLILRKDQPGTARAEERELPTIPAGQEVTA